MSLKVYNSLSRSKEEFHPLQAGEAGIYVCGPTVYGLSHLGHAKSYISFDTIVRYIRYRGYKTVYVQNITDVGHLTDDADEGEDKIAKKARSERVHPMAVAEMYTAEYFRDMDTLGILRPDISPRATGHIPEQIEMIRLLIEKNLAYEAGGSVYYYVPAFPRYGRLSGRNIEEVVQGTRVEIREEKRNPADFALWKKAEPGHLMRWDSPWSIGYPGWHIECSAMSMKYLGESFDIHGGGLDNQFPHHECEIAQSEGASDKPFVKYWLHNNLVTVNGQKMGKSLGNFITLKDAFKEHSPLAIRFFVLQSHYRSPLDFSTEAIKGAESGLEKLLNGVRTLRAELERRSLAGEAPEEASPNVFTPLHNRFLEAMDDDFNSSQAIALLFDIVREANQAVSAGGAAASTLSAYDRAFREFGGTVLGIIPDRLEAAAAGGGLEGKLIQLAIDVRTEARKQKLWQFSDIIRDGLKTLGVLLEDKKEGTSYKITKPSE